MQNKKNCDLKSILFNNHSLSPNGLLTQNMRARGIIVLVKSNYLVKNIETKLLQLVKARL